ncbi:hypothetical protein SAMN04487904_113120 [Actinopolyspora lacussalsi subsp. righensis]|uniref:DUF2357 domain-containing protein n=1 Tax=Actinopolyspora righensis TaxID=995060 RepID=A0A1I7BZU2_9ACTN|nr:DUF2357 domain-containing protein [Actinopolyspora righensis]SFT92680.1 hypothetical protein SAMN04487904_113120 [Actinopolyspora righensis]
MPTTHILHISAPFVEFELRGPTHSDITSVERLSGPVTQLHVDSSTGSADVVVLGETAATDPGASKLFTGPPLFEDTTYRIRAKSKIAGQLPQLVHRDPQLLRNIDTFSDDLTSMGTINFNRQVGVSRLDVQVGHEMLRITLEIFPTKIDYATDYQTMVTDVASTVRSLALEYLRATYRTGTAYDTDDTSSLDWLTLVRNEIDTIERAIHYINTHPERTLVHEIANTPISRIRKADSAVRRAIIKGSGRGPSIPVSAVGQVRSVLPSVQNTETADTNEHRWIRLNLLLIIDRLSEIHRHLLTEVQQHQKDSNTVSVRRAKEESEVAEFLHRVNLLVDLPIFAGINKHPPPGFSSLALHNSTGYGDAYRAITALRLGLSTNGTGIDLSVMDVHELYETWCFIEVVRIILSKTGTQGDLSELLAVEESGIRIRLAHGKRSSVACEFSHINLEVTYNQRYPTLTGEQRPDIVLRIQHRTWPELVILLDAKYRLDNSQSYRQQFDCVGPPVKAINALHRYRDAIVVGPPGEQGRPVVKGAALFPMSREESKDFQGSRLQRALEHLGIGALPFLPGNTNFLEEWLDQLIQLPPEELAVPGLPHIGLQEVSRRTKLTGGG